MRIRTIAAIAMTALLTSCSSFFGTTPEKVKKNLEEATYTVNVIDGSTYADSDENPFPFLLGSELDTFVYGEKGEDRIYVYFFYFIEDAESNYTFMTMPGLSSGQNNKAVYFGTRQAIKDAQI